MHFSSLNFAPVIKTLLLKMYFVIQCYSIMDILINCEVYSATSFVYNTNENNCIVKMVYMSFPFINGRANARSMYF